MHTTITTRTVSAAAVTTMSTSMHITITMRTVSAAAVTTMSTSMHTTITTRMVIAPAATTITTMRMRFSPPGAVRPIRSSLRLSCRQRSCRSIPAGLASSCVQRASFRVRMGAGSILILFPARAISARVLPTSLASCVSSAPIWTRTALQSSLGCEYDPDPCLCIYRLPGFR